MEYLYKSALLLSIFYLFYKIVLEKETFFQANRWYLLAGMVLSLLVPLLVIPIYREVLIQGVNTGFTTDSFPVAAFEKSWSTKDILWFSYWIGVFFFTVKYLISLGSLFRLLTKNERKRVGNYIFINTKSMSSPFSFLNFIVLNENQFSTTELQGVIAHEKVHINQLHTIDLLLINLLQIVLWFNPLVWFYKRALQQNLEYIADTTAQAELASPKEYQYLLLKTSTTIQPFAQCTNFYNSLIKKRIIMLQKNQSKKQNKLKYLLMLPLLGAFLFSFNRKEVIHYVVKENPVKSTEIANSKNNTDLVITISKNTSDSELTAYQKQFEAASVVFSYSGVKRNKKGEIKAIKLKLISKDKSQQVSNAYAIKDGAISPLVLGVAHKKLFIKSLKDKGVTVIDTTKNSDATDTTQFTIVKTKANAIPKDVLYVLDGKQLSADEIKDIEMGSVKSIHVYKGTKALEKYGKKGEYGVIAMDTQGENEFSKAKVNYLTKDKFEKLSEHVLFVVDAKVVDFESAEKTLNNGVASVQVFKGEKALEKYGEAARNGVVVVNTSNDEKNIKTTVIQSTDSNGAVSRVFIVDGEKMNSENATRAYKNGIESAKIINGNIAVITTKKEKSTGFVSLGDKTYYYIIEKDKLQFYNRNGEQVKDAKLLASLQKKVAKGNEYTLKTSNNQANDKGFLSYKNKDYYYNIADGKLTFYTKYGEVVQDKKLVKKLKRML